MIKIIFYNFLILIVLLFIVILIPPLSLDTYRLFKKLSEPAELRVNLEYYKDKAWAETHFTELKEQSFQYYDFIGWRKKFYQGSTININKDGFRYHNSLEPAQTDLWMFGGSTVFGAGSKDKETIVGFIEAKKNIKTFNMGENAYTTHQDFNLLMKMNKNDSIKDKHIIFFGGVNDVIHKCRVELNSYSTAQEKKIGSRLDGRKNNIVGNEDQNIFFMKVFEPTIDVIKKIKSRILSSSAGSENFYDCHKNEKKVKEIVKYLISDWELANYIVKKEGGKFLAILQPVSHFSNPNLDHLSYLRDRKIEKKQFEVVYNEILNQLKLSLNFNFLDLTKLFDTNEQIFIDYAHYTPEGNAKIADEIIKHLKL